MNFSPPICLGFNARKAAQVVAYLASKTNDRMLPVVKAVKLVYLADRKSLEEFGFPILDEDRYSMPHGPVNSTTYSHIKGEYDVVRSGWSEFLRDREDHKIQAVKKLNAADCDELSDADIECLDDVWRRFGSHTPWGLVGWTHKHDNVPEWEDPKRSSRPIPLLRILSALKVEGAEDQAAIIEDMGNINALLDQLEQDVA